MTQPIKSMSQAPLTVTSNDGNRYLTFALGSEEYGVSILKVKEIIGMVPITAMPHTPDFVKGVIRLRGKSCPILDLRKKFGMADAAYTDLTCIVMVEIAGRHQTLLTGIIVDSVSEVINIKNENIEAIQGFGADLNMEFILGIAKMEGMVRILLNIDRTLNATEIAMLNRHTPYDIMGLN
ncbi:MAG: chemotaxis protein CheW [Desulfobulbaceae bacterium]|nr:chemotaxis protein CheW [Desulfobulbaceae bacterium]